MAFRRILLQPTTRLTAAVAQEPRFAITTHGWRSAVAWVNVFANGTSGVSTIKFEGVSSLSLPDDTALVRPFWLNITSFTIGTGTVGAFPSATFAPLSFLRWNVSSMTGTPLAFEVVVYLWDT